MPSIEQNLAAILAAKYGKDVRQAIHDSIGQNYEDVVNGRIYMDGATDDANAAAALANTKAGLADTAAISANDAATLANTKAGLANTAAISANDAATLANTKAGLAEDATDDANMAAQEALDNIIISASFSGNNINFTKANAEVITLLNAKSELRGETGLNMNGSSGALLFVGDEASAKAQSIEVTFSASLGGLMYGVTIVAVSGLPEGMTYAISLNGSTGAKVTFTSTTSMVSPYGLITVICASVPNVGSRTIKIPYAIAFKGHSISSAEVSGDDLIFHLTDETIITVANAMKDVNDAAVEARETYYLGPDQPISNNAKIWLDTDEPDLMADYQDVLDAGAAAVVATGLADDATLRANTAAQRIEDTEDAIAGIEAADATAQVLLPQMENAILDTEAAVEMVESAHTANANWTKDTANPLFYFPAPSAQLYFRREGTFTQAGSGDPSPTNIRPITPFMASGATVSLWNRGKNQFNDTLEQGAYDSSGAKASSANEVRSVGITTHPAGQALMLSYVSTTATTAIRLVYYINGTYSRTVLTTTANQYILSAPAATENGLAFHLTKTSITPAKVSRIQLELNATVATAYEAYTGSTATLTAPEEIATGWINNRGEGQKTWTKKVFDGTEFFAQASSYPAGFRAVAMGIPEAKYNASIFCSHFIKIGSELDTVYERIAIESSNGAYNLRLKILSSRLTTDNVTGVKEYLAAEYAAGHPVTIVYELDTPTALTPVSAPLNSIPATDLTVERQNIFTASLQGQVTYPKNKPYENRKLWNSALWRKTTLANPVSAIYPVPESNLYPRVYGTYTQSGTGDPSPDNIRPITPWLASGASVAVKRTGKNLVDFLGRTLGNAGAYASTTVRAWDETKYYIGVSRDNYYNSAGTFSISGTTISFTGSGAGYGLAFPVRIKPSTVYTCSVSSASPNPFIGCGYYTSEGVFINAVNQQTSLSFSVTTPANAGWLVLNIAAGTTLYTHTNLQLELGSTATPYEPYSGQEITLTAPQEIAAGWMGNEGVGSATHWRRVMTGSETPGIYGVSGTVIKFAYSDLFSPAVKYVNSNSAFSIGSHSLAQSANGYNNLANRHYSASPGTGLLFNIEAATIGTTAEATNADKIAAMKAYTLAQYSAGTPITICYEPATPTTLTLNPYPAPLYATPQLDMITPRQNVLTASTGNIELTYAKSPIQQANEVEAAIALLS